MQDHLDVKGLADELVDAEILCQRVRVRGAADRDHPRATARAAIELEELRSVHAAPEIEVEEDDVGLPHLDLAKSEMAAGRRRDLIAVVAKRELQRPDGGVVVLDDQNSLRHSAKPYADATSPMRGDAALLRHLVVEARATAEHP